MKKNNLIDELTDALRCLPGVGPRSASRMAYHLLQFKREQGKHLAVTLDKAMHNISHCTCCNNFSEFALCPVCDDIKRDQQVLCVVELPSDVIAIEQSNQYRGQYFVLMGHLSPLDGIGPEQLAIDKLFERIATGAVEEVIFAINPTVEGEATIHYIASKLAKMKVKLSQLAHGIPIGGELGFLDGHTIGRAITDRAVLYREKTEGTVP